MLNGFRGKSRVSSMTKTPGSVRGGQSSSPKRIARESQPHASTRVHPERIATGEGKSGQPSHANRSPHRKEFPLNELHRARAKAGSPSHHGHASKTPGSHNLSRARHAHEAAARVVPRRGAAHGVAVVDSGSGTTCTAPRGLALLREPGAARCEAGRAACRKTTCACRHAAPAAKDAAAEQTVPAAPS